MNKFNSLRESLPKTCVFEVNDSSACIGFPTSATVEVWDEDDEFVVRASKESGVVSDRVSSVDEAVDIAVEYAESIYSEW